MFLFSLVDALPMAETSQTQNLSAIIGGSGRKSNSHLAKDSLASAISLQQPSGALTYLVRHSR